MTLVESREIVFATTPPHPASNARAMTRPFVPGGPDPRTKGFLNFKPFTSTAKLGFVIRFTSLRGARRKTIFEDLHRFFDLARADVERRRDADDVALQAAATDQEPALLGLLEQREDRARVVRAVAG